MEFGVLELVMWNWKGIRWRRYGGRRGRIECEEVECVESTVGLGVSGIQ